MTLSIIVSIVSALAILSVWRKPGGRHLSVIAANLWTGVWLVVAIVFWQPELTNRLADLLHVGRGADVVVYAAIIIILYLVFRLFVKLDKLDRAITALTRHQAVHDHEDRRHTDRQL